MGKQSAFVPDFRRGSGPWSWTCPVWTGGSFGFMELILIVFVWLDSAGNSEPRMIPAHVV